MAAATVLYTVVSSMPEPAEPVPVYETFAATAYTADCDGCTGVTYTGIDVNDTVLYGGVRIIAVDPDVIPLGSTVEVRKADGSTFIATAQDVGGAIKGRRIDVLVRNKPTARVFGRQDVELRIINDKETVK